MHTILNAMSVIATFAIAQVVLYVFFNALLFKVTALDKVVIDRIQIKHILYFTIGTIFLLKYTEFYLPYKN